MARQMNRISRTRSSIDVNLKKNEIITFLSLNTNQLFRRRRFYSGAAVKGFLSRWAVNGFDESNTILLRAYQTL